METYAQWLGGLGHQRLSEVLRLRPDAWAAPQPQSLAQLAARLESRSSVHRALTGLDLGALQVAEVLQGLGDGVARDRVADLVAPALSPEALDDVLAALERRALAWADRAGRLRFPPALVLVPAPLGLGPPVAGVLAGMSAAELKGIASALRLRSAARKAEVVTLLIARLSDPVAVRHLVAGAPPAMQELLHRAAVGEPVEDSMLSYPRTANPAVQWAVTRGLLVRRHWLELQMPREVALALRGDDWRPALRVPPPPLAHAEAAPDVVQRAAAAAAAAALHAATALLDALATAPATALKSGGVGARELRRVAKLVRLHEDDVALWLDVAAAGGLVRECGGEVLVTDAYDEWRAGEPAQRLVSLLLAWRELPWAPTQRVDLEGKAVPAVAPPGVRARVGARVRTRVLELAGAVPGRALVSPEALVQRVAWDCPLAYPSDDGLDAFVRQVAAATWREAETLGLVGAGALTDLGRALLAEPPAGPPGEAPQSRPVPLAQAGEPQAAATGLPGLREQAARLLPAAVATATFQADLTAVVAGTPSAGLAALLDSAADLESGGAASVWRFTSASVRRAYDAGTSAQSLQAELAAVAARELPQPLTYLLADVARRHGAMRVRPVTSCVCSDDTALLTEIAAHRGLAALALRRLAPTVLASGRPVQEVLGALRAAGYAPVGESADGVASVERAAPRRAAVEPPVRQPTKPGQPTRPDRPSSAEQLAAALLASPPPAVAPPPTARIPAPAGGPTTLFDAAPIVLLDELPDAGAVPDLPDPAALPRRHLSAMELELLMHAAATGDQVQLSYVNAAGNVTERVVDDVVIEPPLLYAWCHLRDDERVFRLDGILEVAPTD